MLTLTACGPACGQDVRDDVARELRAARKVKRRGLRGFQGDGNARPPEEGPSMAAATVPE